MDASLLELLVAGAAAVVVGVGVAVIVTGLLLWRAGRRRWRAFRSHGVVTGAVGLWEASRTLAWPRGGATPPERIGHLPARLARRELWRSVDRAAAAVRAADGVGAATAGLPGLCTRLRAVAIDLDRVLRVDPGAPVPPSARDQLAEVVRAADDVRRAALASAGEATGHSVSHLAEDAGAELSLLEAGLASARRALPPPSAR